MIKIKEIKTCSVIKSTFYLVALGENGKLYFGKQNLETGDFKWSNEVNINEESFING